MREVSAPGRRLALHMTPQLLAPCGDRYLSCAQDGMSEDIFAGCAIVCIPWAMLQRQAIMWDLLRMEAPVAPIKFWASLKPNRSTWGCLELQCR